MTRVASPPRLRRASQDHVPPGLEPLHERWIADYPGVQPTRLAFQSYNMGCTPHPQLTVT